VDATHDPEEWRPVVGYEGAYEVSNQGRVRSLDRTIIDKRGNSKRLQGKVMKPYVSADRYHEVHLQESGRRELVRLHTLVLEAFVGPRPDLAAACHNDGDGGNNRLSNLRWDSYSENNLDLVRHGVHWQARKTHCKHGHEFSPGNTITNECGQRRCKTCQYAAIRDWKARHAPPPAPLKTHCKNGHEFTPENTRTRTDGKGRRCITCQRAAIRRYNSRNRSKRQSG
jgi:hypothetical protein